MSAPDVFRYQRAVTRAPNRPRTMAARAAALVIALHTRDGACHLTREQIADEIGAGIWVTRAAVQELKRSGWLLERPGKGAPCFQIVTPEPRADLHTHGGRICTPMEGEPRADLHTHGGRICTPMEGGSAHPTPSRRPPKKPPAETPSDPAVDDPIRVGGLGGAGPRPNLEVFEPILRTVDPQSPKVIAAEPKAQSPARAPAKRRRPEAWAPTAKHFAKGIRLGFGEQRVNTEAEKFGEHHDARGNLFVDWDAAFSAWLGKAREIDDARGVPREEPDDPLFRAPGEPWVKQTEPPRQRTPEEQAAVDEAFARYKIAREASIRQHSRSEHRRIAEAEREADLAAETDPERLKLIEITRRRRAELEAQESMRRVGSEMN